MLMQQVHQCEFCHASFQPRPQVKNPRACNLLECQEKRQRSNEVAWRQKNGTTHDPQYHRLRKASRLKQLKEISLMIGRCVSTGARFLNQSQTFESFQELLFKFLTSLGLRRINKLWVDGISQCKSMVNETA